MAGQTLFRALRAKDVPAVDALTATLAGSLREAFMRLPELYGGADVIATARTILPGLPGVIRALDELEILVGMGNGIDMAVDLADLRGYGYHTGVVFAVYVGGQAQAVALGGRYNGTGAICALQGVAWLIESTWPLIAVPASWSWATWGVAGLTPALWLALLAGACVALAPLPAAGRCAGCLLVLASCAWRAPPPDHGAVHFAMLDVGQGHAAVVATRHHVLVYDAGPAFRSGGDAGAMAVERVPAPSWRARGRRARCEPR